MQCSLKCQRLWSTTLQFSQIWGKHRGAETINLVICNWFRTPIGTTWEITDLKVSRFWCAIVISRNLYLWVSILVTNSSSDILSCSKTEFWVVYDILQNNMTIIRGFSWNVQIAMFTTVSISQNFYKNIAKNLWQNMNHFWQ